MAGFERYYERILQELDNCEEKSLVIRTKLTAIAYAINGKDLDKCVNRDLAALCIGKAAIKGIKIWGYPIRQFGVKEKTIAPAVMRDKGDEMIRSGARVIELEI